MSSRNIASRGKFPIVTTSTPPWDPICVLFVVGFRGFVCLFVFQGEGRENRHVK